MNLGGHAGIIGFLSAFVFCLICQIGTSAASDIEITSSTSRRLVLEPLSEFISVDESGHQIAKFTNIKVVVMEEYVHDAKDKEFGIYTGIRTYVDIQYNLTTYVHNYTGHSGPFLSVMLGTADGKDLQAGGIVSYSDGQVCRYGKEMHDTIALFPSLGVGSTEEKSRYFNVIDLVGSFRIFYYGLVWNKDMLC